MVAEEEKEMEMKEMRRSRGSTIRDTRKDSMGRSSKRGHVTRMRGMCVD